MRRRRRTSASAIAPNTTLSAKISFTGTSAAASSSSTRRASSDPLVVAVGREEVLDGAVARGRPPVVRPAAAGVARVDGRLRDGVPPVLGGALAVEGGELLAAVGGQRAGLVEGAVLAAVERVDRDEHPGLPGGEELVQRVLAREHVGRELPGDDRLVVVLLGHVALGLGGVQDRPGDREHGQDKGDGDPHHPVIGRRGADLEVVRPGEAARTARADVRCVGRAGSGHTREGEASRPTSPRPRAAPALQAPGAERAHPAPGGGADDRGPARDRPPAHAEGGVRLHRGSGRGRDLARPRPPGLRGRRVPPADPARRRDGRHERGGPRRPVRDAVRDRPDRLHANDADGGRARRRRRGGRRRDPVRALDDGHDVDRGRRRDRPARAQVVPALHVDGPRPVDGARPTARPMPGSTACSSRSTSRSRARACATRATG